MSPNYETIHLILRKLLEQKGDFNKLGKHFVTRFVQRHPELKSDYSRKMNAKRVSVLDTDIINTFFVEFKELCTTYKIDMEDVYNMDETGFQISHIQFEYVVYKSLQDPIMISVSENTNWILIIECISVQKVIKSYLIFTDKNLETNWFSLNEQLLNFIYVFSEKDWNDDELVID